jgi:hypothetical protein
MIGDDHGAGSRECPLFSRNPSPGDSFSGRAWNIRNSVGFARIPSHFTQKRRFRRTIGGQSKCDTCHTIPT